MRKIKILFTIPNFNTAGSGKHMVDLIRNLDHDRYEPHICVDHEQGNYYSIVKEFGYPIITRRLSPNRGNYLSAMKQVLSNARFLRKQGFDVIHSFHWKSDWFEPLAAKLAGIPWVFTKKSMVWHKHWTMRTKLAKFVFTLNPEMSTLYPISDSKSTCVGLGPNVVEVIERVQKHDKEQVKKDLGLEGKLVLLSIANIVPVKNIDYLIKAFSQLSCDKQKHLFIVGDKDSDYGRSLEELVTELGISHQVTLTGKVIDVEKYISIADLYIQPTSQHGRSEASGVACMEACAAGVPSIGSDVAGLRFVIGDQNLLFEPDSEDALVEKINDMLAKENKELKEVGDQLQKRMYELFHMPIVAIDHEKVYEKFVCGTN